MTKPKWLIASMFTGFLLGILPTVVLVMSFGHYPSVPFEIMDDTIYYLGRVREVMAGNYFIGNSYLLEHVKSVTTAFFVADWIYSIPFFILSIFKAPLALGIIFSEVLWSVILAVLLYILYGKLNVPNKYKPISIFITILPVLLFVIRPVTMSVVFPTFILFLISFKYWIDNPEGNKQIWFLTLSSALSFYVYTYLWQVVLIILGLTLIYKFLLKESSKQIITVLSLTFIFSIPAFLYVWKQVTSEFYFETLNRVGLINTHTIGGAAIIYSLLLALCIFIIFILYRSKQVEKNNFIFFGIIFSGLFIAGISNVVTGKDLELAVHIGRFTDLIIPIFLVFIFSNVELFNSSKNWLVSLPIVVLLGMSLYGVFGVYKAFNYVQNSSNFDEFEGFLAFLASDGHKSVILANDQISSYIPILTDDYVLFHPNAELYLSSNEEIEERYLVSRMFTRLTIDQVRSDYRKYSGVGNAVHIANVQNRKFRLCVVLKKIKNNLDCGFSVDPYSIKGDRYFERLLSLHSNISNDYLHYLKKYNVSFILVGDSSEWSVPGSFEEVWRGSGYRILKVK